VFGAHEVTENLRGIAVPSKTSKTTRKAGTVTRIKLYADERRCLLRAGGVIIELSELLGEGEPQAKLAALSRSLDAAVETYRDYQDNVQASLGFDESSESSETTDAASGEISGGSTPL